MHQIPTMQNGPDLAKRFHKELTDIQVSALKVRGNREELLYPEIIRCVFFFCLTSLFLTAD